MATDDDFKAQNPIPLEYETPIRAAQRKRAMAEVMLASGLQQRPLGQMVGQYFAPTNPLQFLAQGLQQYAGRTGVEAADKSEADARQKYSTDLAAALAGMQQAKGPQAQISLGRGSVFPEIRKMAEGIAKQQQDIWSKAADAADPTFVVTSAKAGGDVNKLQPHFGANPRYEFVPTPTGEKIPVAVTTNRKGEQAVHNLGIPKTEVNVGAENKGLQKWLEQGATSAYRTAEKSHETASGLPALLGSVAQATGLLDQGVKTGLPADIMAAGQNLAKFFGVNLGDPAGVESLKSILNGQVFEKLGGLGAQISDADRKFVERLNGSTLQDPGTIRSLLAILAGKTMEALTRHNARIEALASNAPDDHLREGFISSFSVPFNFKTNQGVAAQVDNVLDGRPAGPYEGVGSGAAPAQPAVPAAGPAPTRRRW